MRTPLLLLVLGACGTNLTPQPDAVAALPSCTPNRDGVITADELPIALGAQQVYYASPSGATRPVDLAGDPTGWRMSDERPDDAIVGIGPVALGDQWYASQFPNGRFVVDAGAGLVGVYHQDDAALWLDGTASQAANQTVVRYDAPIALLRFPLADGDHATATGAIAGATIDGLPFIGSDVFTTDVTVREHLVVPYVDFSPVARVRTSVVRAPTTGTPKITKRTTLFLVECFGEVARAESQPNETAVDFTTAAYLRRFALGAQP